MTHLTTNHSSTTPRARPRPRRHIARRRPPSSPACGGCYQNRRAIAKLLEMDASGLRDLGLTRGDVAGALALPMSSDPSTHLAEQLGERRRMQRLARLRGMGR